MANRGSESQEETISYPEGTLKKKGRPRGSVYRTNLSEKAREGRRDAAKARAAFLTEVKGRKPGSWRQLRPIQPFTARSDDELSSHGAITTRQAVCWTERSVRPAHTPEDFEEAWLDAQQNSSNSKIVALNRLKETFEARDLAGRAYDLYPLRLEEHVVNPVGQVVAHLNHRMLPLWATGDVEPRELLSVEEYHLHVQRNGRLRGKIADEPEVVDSGLAFGAALRPASLEEFATAMVDRVPPARPLNFLDLVNDTDVRMTPAAILEVSLEAILHRKLGKSGYVAEEFLLASTRGATTLLHVDKMGFLTWVRVIAGGKSWFVPTCSMDAADEIFQQVEEEGYVEQPVCPPRLRFCGANLDEKGGLWVQDAGQKHWVHTGTRRSFFVGGFFYTAASFDLSIRQIRRDLCEGSSANEDPTADAFKLLSDILVNLLDDESVFNDDERIGVAWELRALLRRVSAGTVAKFAKANAEGWGWYHGDKEVQTAFKDFLDEAERWCEGQRVPQ